MSSYKALAKQTTTKCPHSQNVLTALAKREEGVEQNMLNESK